MIQQGDVCGSNFNLSNRIRLDGLYCQAESFKYNSEVFSMGGKLKDEELASVSGGYIFYAKDISGADPNNLWEVINERGEVIGRYNNRDDAIYNAGYNREKYREISWQQLCDLRDWKQI